MLCYENRNYLLCTLKKGSHYQVPLDLNFQEGTKIAFTCNGFGHVHLTGYLTLDEDFDFGDLEEEEDEDEEEEEIPQLVKNKRKAIDSPKNNKKKIKKQETENDNESSDDDDDDDMEAESDSENDDSKLMGEDEVDSDESDDDDDEEEDDSDDDDEEQEVEKPKQKQKQNQLQQNQVGKKQDKQKMVNGKDAKPDGKQKKNKPEQQQQQQNSQQQKRRTIEGGVQVEDLKVGNGTPAKAGRNVSVYYVGRLKNGKKFDETKQGEGFKFKLGNGDVIKGWDVGISGMKVGGKRRLTIPAAMA